MSKLVRRAHNKTNLVYHLVCVVKYRKNVLTENITNTIVNVCLEIQEKYKIEFVEIGTDINQFKLITYDNFFIGYDLFKIGVCMGFKAPTSILMHYLETAHVQTNTMDESQNVLALQQFMATEFSENIKQL